MSSFDTFVTNPPAGAPTPDETRGGLRLAWLGLAWARFAFYTRQHWTERCSAPCSARGSSPLCLPHFVRMGRRLAFEGCVRAGACLPLVVRFRLRGVRFCLVRLFCPLWWSKLCTKLVGRPGDRPTDGRIYKHACALCCSPDDFAFAPAERYCAAQCAAHGFVSNGA